MRHVPTVRRVPVGVEVDQVVRVVPHQLVEFALLNELEVVGAVADEPRVPGFLSFYSALVLVDCLLHRGKVVVPLLRRGSGLFQGDSLLWNLANLLFNSLTNIFAWLSLSRWFEFHGRSRLVQHGGQLHRW